MKNYDEIDKKALEMFNKGISLTKISLELGIDRGRLSNRLKKKFKIQPMKDNRKYHCDDNIFSVIDSEEQAYWLGFLIADGCIRNNQNLVELNLCEKDKEHLIKFNLFLKSNYLIKNRQTTACKNSERFFKSCRLYIVSKQIVSDLKKYNCIENKTYMNDTFPRFNNYELDRACIRGFFDGDGCISLTKTDSVSKVSLTSYSKKLISEILDIAESYVGKLYWKDYKKINTHNVHLKVKSGKKLLYFMYNNANIYLERKYHKYKAFAVHDGNIVDYQWAKSVES